MATGASGSQAAAPASDAAQYLGAPTATYAHDIDGEKGLMGELAGPRSPVAFAVAADGRVVDGQGAALFAFRLEEVACGLAAGATVP